MSAQGTEKNRPTARTHRGFTLIELLMVIAIIGLLVGLLVPAIAGAYKRGKEAAEVTEISNLATALQKIKDRFGVYPPSHFVLIENGNYSSVAWNSIFGDPEVGLSPNGASICSRSVTIQYLRRIWPQMLINTDINSAVNYTQNGIASDLDGDQQTSNDNDDFYDWNGDGVVNGPWFLEGDECLAFFLGGIATGELQPSAGPAGRQAGPIGYIGFCKKARNPAENPVWLARFSTPSATSTTNRDGAYFEFAPDRLMDRDSDGFYEIIPYRRFGQAAYVYFSAYDGAGYRPDDLNLTQEPNGDSTNAVSFAVTWTIGAAYPVASATNSGRSSGTPYYNISFGPNPYTSGVPYATGAGWVPRYIKPDAFQIISPSYDLGYGDGGEFPLPTDCNVHDKDNLSNFVKSEIKDGAN